jgi:hypothetical protein
MKTRAARTIVSIAVAAALTLSLRVAIARADDGGAEPMNLERGLHEHFGAWFLTASPFGSTAPLDDWGMGAGFIFGIGWGKIPLTVGVDFMALWWGTSTSPALVDLGDRSARVELRRSDNTIFFDAWLRAQPQSWFVRPYLEGVVGWKQVYTDYSLRFVGGSGATDKTTSDAGASTYGFGLGLDVTLAHNDQGAVAFVTLGIRRLSGGRASFTRGPDAVTGDPRSRFEVSTDTTIIQLGIIAIASP